MMRFHLDGRSGVPAFQQIAQQVRNGLLLGIIEVGDRLPTVKEVVAQVAVNPNTVLKAYRELEYEGLVQPRPGLGTFVVATIGTTQTSAAIRDNLAKELEQWLAKAANAGLDAESIAALIAHTLQTSTGQTSTLQTSIQTSGATQAGPRQAKKARVAEVNA